MSKGVFVKGVLLAIVAVFAIGSTAAAQGVKMGFVRDDQIQENYKDWQRAQEEWELEKKAWDDEAVTKQQELADLLDEYDKQKLILSEAKRKEKEALIRAKQEALDAYTRQIFGPNGTAEKTQQRLYEPLLQKVTKAIELVAIEGNYDVVFTLQSGLGYIKESYDVTEQVLQKLEEIEE
jgi:outer membrane protein